MASKASTSARTTGTPPQLGSAESTTSTQQRRQSPPKLLPQQLTMPLSRWFSLLCLCALALTTSTATAWAQTFQTIPALSFTKTVNSTSNPLPQVLTVASAGSNFNFYAKVINGTGGAWLTQSTNSGYSQATPFGISLTANPDVSLAAGTYTAQLSLTPTGSSTATLITVSLTIELASATYFDELPGALTFSMVKSGTAPPGQMIPIRNAGSGTLNWTATVHTADGGSWLKLSASSGVAPSTPTVIINPAALPDGGQIVGTYTGQILLKTGSDSVTVPIAVSVGDASSNSVFQQLNPLSFTKTANSPSQPLSQTFTVAGTGANFNFYATVLSGTGGNWLTQSTNSGYSQMTPFAVTATANPATNLPSGVYTAQILLTSSGGHEVGVIPVTLTVDQQTTSAYFDELPGEFTFSLVTGAAAPPSQILPIRNASSGTLNWTALPSTADGGSWLKLSATSGTAPSTPSISIDPSKLPGNGELVGAFSGQVLLTAGTDFVTIPITVYVGDTAANPVFQQLNPINFTKTLNSASQPLSQVVNVASTGNNFNFYATVIEGTGGAWLSQSTNSGYSQTTPFAVTLTANPATNLATGIYTAQVLLTSSGGHESMVVPVTLTVSNPASSTYFDELPGELTFSTITSGAAPPSQVVQIRNAGSGTLNFSASAETSDGGSWLKLSSISGTAPYLLSVSIDPTSLPNGGQVVGTFTGQVLLKTGTDSVTVPVTVAVGDTGSNPVLRQINPINFIKTVNSTSQPLPQIVTVASTGNAFNFYASVIPGTGGDWLTQSTNSGYSQSTPFAVTLTANPAVSLAAGTYTAEVLLTSSGGHESVVVPVTLTVEAATAAYFDELPGGLTFSSQPGTASIPSQPLAIRNAGAGTLNWMASVTTADGGNWLSLSSTQGTSPSSRSVTINRANLPNAGKVAGTFVGQILLQSVSGMVTLPVTVTIGDSVLNQPPALSFSINQGGSAPPTQTLNITSTDTNFNFYAAAQNGTGGSWLSQNTNSGYSQSTPYTLTVAANPATNLAAGVYTSQIVLQKSGGSEPVIVPVTLTVNSSKATATPTFTPPGGTYSTAQHVAITTTTPDAAIYYTTNGSTPTTTSNNYTGPITVSATETLKAIAISPGYPLSAVASATYNLGQAAATPAATSTITITEATSGATVYYTTNGSTPTSSSTKYTGPIAISASTVLKFIAIGSGYNPSQVRTVSTTIQ